MEIVERSEQPGVLYPPPGVYIFRMVGGHANRLRRLLKIKEELGQALGSAQWQTRKMKEQGLVRCTYREGVARFYPSKMP